MLNAIETRLKESEMANQVNRPEIQPNDFGRGINGNEMMQMLVDNRDIDIYKKKQIIYSEGARPLR